MTKIVPADQIERIVGARRLATVHIGRAVSSEQVFYILHSEKCLAETPNLRDCPYSTALDRGIDPDEWHEDVPIVLGLRRGRLVAAEGGER